MQKNLRSLNLEDVDHFKLTKKTLKLRRELQPSKINTDFKSMQVKVICNDNIYIIYTYNVRHACGHVDVGTCPHQVLTATLTLSQPGGADYAHPILVSTPSLESHRCASKYVGMLVCVPKIIHTFHEVRKYTEDYE